MFASGNHARFPDPGTHRIHAPIPTKMPFLALRVPTHQGEEPKNFINNCEPPGIDKLILAIETIPDYEEGLLKATKRNVWKIMCSYTHGDFTQVASRNTATEITANYSEAQVAELVSGACSITLLVAVAFARLLDNETLANEIFSEYRKLFQNEP